MATLSSKTLASTSLDEFDSWSKNPRKLFYQSPYKKAPGSSSPIGLPDAHTYRHRKLSEPWERTDIQHIKKSRKRSKFLDPGIWNYQEHTPDSLSDSDHQVSETSTQEFLQKESFTLPRIPTIEQMYNTTDQPDACDKVYSDNVVQLPSICQDKLVINVTEEKCSDEESEPVIQNTFGSLRQIDTVIAKRKESSNELLPPVPFRPRRMSNANSVSSFSSCDNLSSYEDERKKKIKGTKIQGQKRKGRHAKKGVQFREEKQKKMAVAKPKLPRVIGLRLTINDIKERELPPIITKYLLGCRHQSTYNLISHAVQRKV